MTVKSTLQFLVFTWILHRNPQRERYDINVDTSMWKRYDINVDTFRKTKIYDINIDTVMHMKKIWYTSWHFRKRKRYGKNVDTCIEIFSRLNFLALTYYIPLGLHAMMTGMYNVYAHNRRADIDSSSTSGPFAHITA